MGGRLVTADTFENRVVVSVSVVHSFPYARRPLMKPRNGAIVALLFLATCNEEVQKDDSSNIESAKVALGVVPPSEVAVWQKVGSSSTPDGRYLQAVAFDETRKVVVMFGGVTVDPNTGSISPNKETWEWSPATGKWSNRTAAGEVPDARSGAAMVFD